MPTFAQPVWLTAGLLACCGAIVFMLLSASRRRKRLAQFAAPHLLPLLTANVSPARRRLKNVCFIAGLACVFLALARPQLGSRVVELPSRGIDILVAFDVSKSMLAQDIKPNRLERAKLALHDFAARLDGGRIGLLPFAGASFLLCPLTADYEAFADSLDALHADTIAKGGTSIGAAIREAANVLDNGSNYKILVLLTDGEDLGQDALNAAALARQEKMIIHAVGAGTAQGELIPQPDGGFVKDERGGYVVSKLDEQTLTTVAETTGGIYVPLGAMGQGLEEIYMRRLATLPKSEQKGRRQNLPVERFQWPLAAAVLFFSLEFLLIGRRRPLRLPFIATAGRRWKKLTAAALVGCVFSASSVRAADEGRELFLAGRYKEAAAVYQDRIAKEGGSPVLHFNLGAALHKLGQHDAAAEEFRRALRTDDLSLQEKSYSNRGISQYAAGLEAERQGEVQQAVRQLRQAEDSLKAALSLNKNRKDAERLLRQAEERRKRLEQQKPEEPPQNGGQSSPEQKEKKSQDKQRAQDGKNQDKQGGSEKNKESRQQDGQDRKEQEHGGESGQKVPRQEQPPSQAEKQDGGSAAEKKDSGQQSGHGETTPKPAPAPGQKQQGKEQSAAAGQGGKDRQQNQQPDRQGKEETKIMGKMTEEEARNLLDSLKSEQSELSFIPQEAADSEAVGRDW